MKWRCDLCGKTVRRRRFILLNRFMVGTGRNRKMYEVGDHDGQSLWDENEQTGYVLHYTPCLLDWLGAQSITVDWEAERPK